MAQGTSRLDRRIIDAWELHEKLDPEISTERLMAMVQDETGAEPDRQLEALQRAGMLQALNRVMVHRLDQGH